jgi:probable rRNA maturation factor
MIYVDLVIKYNKWLETENIEKKITKICQKLIPLTNLWEILNHKTKIEVAILLVGSAKMKNLNLKYRGKNYSTNVLSFPATPEELIKNGNLKNLKLYDNYLFLGDIICCFEAVRNEARLENKNFFDHLTHLILHSILHLIGYDHQNPSDAKLMENLEIKILQELNIKNPYKINS